MRELPKWNRKNWDWYHLNLTILKWATLKINQFYALFNDITNSCSKLGKKISQPILVHKLISSLTGDHIIKVITIEKSKDVDTLIIDELAWSIQTYEHILEHNLFKDRRSKEPSPNGSDGKKSKTIVP